MPGKTCLAPLQRHEFRSFADPALQLVHALERRPQGVEPRDLFRIDRGDAVAPWRVTGSS